MDCCSSAVWLIVKVRVTKAEDLNLWLLRVACAKHSLGAESGYGPHLSETGKNLELQLLLLLLLPIKLFAQIN